MCDCNTRCCKAQIQVSFAWKCLKYSNFWGSSKMEGWIREPPRSVSAIYGASTWAEILSDFWLRQIRAGYSQRIFYLLIRSEFRHMRKPPYLLIYHSLLPSLFLPFTILARNFAHIRKIVTIWELPHNGYLTRLYLVCWATSPIEAKLKTMLASGQKRVRLRYLSYRCIVFS